MNRFVGRLTARGKKVPTSCQENFLGDGTDLPWPGFSGLERGTGRCVSHGVTSQERPQLSPSEVAKVRGCRREFWGSGSEKASSFDEGKGQKICLTSQEKALETANPAVGNLMFSFLLKVTL